MWLQALVARDRRGGDGRERGQSVQDAGREGLGLAGHPLRPASPVEDVAAPPVPKAEVQMRPVAYEAGEHDRGERGSEALVPGDRADRVPDDQVRVGDRDPRPVRNRQLELPGRVLRVELHHASPLLLEGADQRRRERLDLDERDRAVRGPRVCGLGLRLAGSPGAMPEEELHLVGSAQLEPEASEPLEHAPRERPGAPRIGLALLIQLVDRRERPAGARSQRHRGRGIGHQACIARRPSDVGGRGDRIVDEEDGEHGG